ncbi:MAG: hypothetical protein ABEK16_00540 [Candidatus Nanohalobium sp.]
MAFSAAGQPEAAQTAAGSNQSISGSQPSNVTINAGAVVNSNVSQSTATDKWAGFFGTISASRVLGSPSATLYKWTASTLTNAEVIVTPQSSPVPTTLSQVSNPDTFLGSGYKNGPAAASKTFTETESIQTMSQSKSTVSVDLYGSSGSANETFTTLLYNDGNDGSDDPVYVANGTSTTTGFDGSTVNYQLLVGVGDSNARKTFTFYLSIP